MSSGGKGCVTNKKKKMKKTLDRMMGTRCKATREVQWLHGWCTPLGIKQSRFKPWPGILFCALGGTLYSHSASLHPGV